MPKSSSFTCASRVTMMLDGLRSRWAISFACAWPTASRTCRIKSSRASMGSLFRRQCSLIAMPSTHSIARYGCWESADAGIVELRDVRMGQSRQDIALALEPAPQHAGHQVHVRQLERDLPIQRSVAACGQPYFAHAAAAEPLLQEVGSDACACLHSGGRRIRRLPGFAGNGAPARPLPW